MRSIQKAEKADLDQVVREIVQPLSYLFLKVNKDLVRDLKQYPVFVGKCAS